MSSHQERIIGTVLDNVYTPFNNTEERLKFLESYEKDTIFIVNLESSDDESSDDDE